MAADHPAPTVDADVLAPLRARYVHWLGLDEAQVVADREEAAGDIRAMQLVLRMERVHPPSWHDAVALAASATALLCLDPRVTAADGPWRGAVTDYARGHIRKVTRRARASQWQAVQELPGVTLSVPGRPTGASVASGAGAALPLPTEVRALLPGRVAEVDKRIAKLQVGGTDAPVDDPGPEPAGRPLLRTWLPPTPSGDVSTPLDGQTPRPVMTLGKTMAQVGHASMIAAALLAGEVATRTDLTAWIDQGCRADVRRADPGQWADLGATVSEPHRAWQQDRLLAVRDAGFTEIAPGTVTVIAQFG